MLAEPYQTVFNKMRDMLTHDFIGLPEVPAAVMIGNSKMNRLIELNIHGSCPEHKKHDENFFNTYSKLTAFEMDADFALSYTEGWTIPGMMLEGASMEQMDEAIRPFGNIENHPDAKQILTVSIECIDKSYRTEICPITAERKLGAWEHIPAPPLPKLSEILEICREPDQLTKYQAFMERLTQQPEPAEMH